MRKHKDTAFLGYFILLLLVVFSNLISNISLVNIVYLIVVLSCSLKFILIVNENKK